MMNFIRRFTLTLFVLSLFALPAQAQTIITNTTLGAALNATQTNVTLAAAQTLGVDAIIFVPGVNPEVMRVTVAGTAATVYQVARGMNGSQARPHSNAAVVFVGPANRFQAGPPSFSACNRLQIAFLPWIDINTGISWSCNGNPVTGGAGTWYGGSVTALAYNSVPLSYLVLPKSEPLLLSRR